MRFIVILLVTILICGQILADAKGDEVLKKALEAKGGLKALKKINTIVSAGEGLLLTSSGDKQVIKLLSRIVLPDKYYIQLNLQARQIVRIINEDKIRVTLNGQTLPQTKEQDIETFASKYRSEIYVLSHLDSKELKTTYISETTWQDMKVHKVNLEVNGYPVTYYIDTETNRIAGKSYESKGAMGIMSMEEIYRDFKTIEGIVFPMKTLTRVNGTPYMDMTLSSIEINTKIDKETFTIK
jgi:hypothetical protein